MPRKKLSVKQKKANIARYFKKYYATHKEELRAKGRDRYKDNKTRLKLADHYEALMSVGGANG